MENSIDISGIKVIRATETWQKAGAYYVRIQGMAKQHGITLRAEFDEHDEEGSGTRYIVLTDSDFPVATCRIYDCEDGCAAEGCGCESARTNNSGCGCGTDDVCGSTPDEEPAAVIGRVVVLPEYRGAGLGRMVVEEAERWLREDGYKRVVVESRDVATGFYEKMGYRITGDEVIHGCTFECLRMEKPL